MNIRIEHIERDDIKDILTLCDNVFASVIQGGIKNYVNYATNWDISIKLMKDDTIIGFYLFSIKKLSKFDIFKDKKGIEGIALGVDEKYRGLGYGNILINESINMFKNDYDYIWGKHLKRLNNLEDWKKKRTILKENKRFFISYVFFNKL
jgi:ribosomal protein S18 acetylase RimI-like enzyme